MPWQPIPSVTEPHYLDTNLNQVQKCVNWYFQKTASGSILKSVHGLLSKSVVPTGGCRGAKYDPVSLRLFSAHGNTIYKIDYDGTATALTGTLTTSIGPVVFSSGLSQVMLVDGTNGYIINPIALTVTQITDANFPANPTSCACINGQFLASKVSSDRWYMSAVDDGLTWMPVISGRTLINGDTLGHIVVVRDVVYFMSDFTIEIWSPSTVDPYLQPITGATIMVGLGGHLTAGLAVGTVGDSIFFFGNAENSRRGLYKLGSGGLTKISTPYIDSQIEFWGDSGQRVIAYHYDGCEFAEFYERESSGHVGFLYNATFDAWSEIETDRKLAYVANAFPATNPVAFNISNGTVYWLGGSNDYGGTAITRILDFKVDGGMSRTVNQGIRFELEAQHDSSSSYTLSATLQKSDDAGRTFGGSVTLSKAITNGTSAQQVVMQTPPLGSFKAGRIYRLTFTGPAARLILRRAEGLVRVGRF